MAPARGLGRMPKEVEFTFVLMDGKGPVTVTVTPLLPGTDSRWLDGEEEGGVLGTEGGWSSALLSQGGRVLLGTDSFTWVSVFI